MCCPCPSTDEVSKSDSKRFLAMEGLHEDKLFETLQAIAHAIFKAFHQTFLLHIESTPDRHELFSPTHGQRSQQQSGQMSLQSVLINKPMFLKATRRAKRRRIEIIRKSMEVEALSW